MDAWIRWSHKSNGWEWAVMNGASVVAEGSDRSKGEATRCAIAAAFVANLKAALTEQQFAEMQNLNAVADAGICHSHDYCDANEVMADAFFCVMGRELDTQSDEDRALWSDSWDYAKTHGLGQDADVEAAAIKADAQK